MDFDKKWYDSLKKSPLTPPNQIFGIVWPILYVLIVVSLVLFIMAYDDQNIFVSPALIFFTIQMILNLLWSPIFFKQKRLCLSLFIIMTMVIFVILTMIQFYKYSKIASWLLLPYLLWILFATYLNFYICVNN